MIMAQPQFRGEEQTLRQECRRVAQRNEIVVLEMSNSHSSQLNNMRMLFIDMRKNSR